MPLGESVGRAYVRLFIDGEGIPEQIRQALMDAEPDIETQGAKGSQAYQKGWDENLAKNKRLGVSLKDRLDDAIAEVDATKAFFDSPQWKRFEKEVERRFPGVGELAARRMAEGFKARGSTQGLEKAISDIMPNIRRTVEEITRLEEEAFRERRKQQEAQAKEAARALDRAYRQEEQRHKQHLADKKRAEEQFERERLQRTIEETNRLQREAYRDLVADNQRLARSFTGIRTSILSLVHTMRTDLTRQMKASSRDAHVGTSVFTRLGKSLDRTADITGRAFGRGSRNNFLNFFGSVVRNATGLLSVIPRLTGGLIEMSRTFSSLFRAARETQGVFGALFTAARGAGLLAGAFTLLTSLLVAFPVAIAVVVVALAALATVISGVTAAITALAGSLSFALVGALAPLVALVPVLGAGLGVLVLGISGLAKESKRLKEATRPLLEEFRELRDIAGKPLFEAIERNAGSLEKVLRSLRPVVREVSQAFGDILDVFARAATSPGAERFLAYLEDIVPDAIRSLGRSLANAFGGFGGLLIAMEPTLRRFLSWLEGVTLEFSNWANSKGGRQEIREFLRDAEESLGSVWGFLKSIGGLVGLLFGEGKTAGDSIFASMERNVRKFTRYLRDNPDALNKWFKHGKEIAATLGEIVVLTGNIIDILDSPTARSAVSWMKDEIHQVNKEWSILEGHVEKVSGWGRKIGRSFKEDFLGAIKDWGKTVATSFVEDFLEVIKEWAKFVGESFVADFIKPIQDGLKWVAEKLGIELNEIEEPWFMRKAVVPPGLQAITGESIQAAKALAKANKTALSFKDSVDSVPDNIRLAAEVVDGVAKAALEKLVKPRKTDVTPEVLDRQARGALDKLVAPRKADVTANPIVAMAEAALNSLSRARTAVINVVANGVDIVRNALNSVTGWFQANINFNRTAAGGVFSSPQVRLISEAGPEAVVPLKRPLSQVDPSVRALSAFAQGLAVPGAGGASRSIQVGDLTVVTPTEDPVAVAHEVINALVASGY